MEGVIYFHKNESYFVGRQQLLFFDWGDFGLLNIQVIFSEEVVCGLDPKRSPELQWKLCF